MLRAAPDHPKFANLMSVLKQPKGPTAGWLEMIWHFTGRFTPQGNVGKYPDSAIEAWVGWDGEPGALISALVKTRWVDEDPIHRLLIHDWHQHADKATKNALIRAKLLFFMPTVRTPGEHVRTVATKPSSAYRPPEPEPVPEPEPETSCAETSSAPAFHNGKRLTLPCLSGDWPVSAESFRKWAQAYPAADITTELLKAGLWLEANPKNRKTASGMPNFILGWLSRTQNSARPDGGSNGYTAGNRNQQRTDGIRAAAEAAANAINSVPSSRAGGGQAGERELGDSPTVFRPAL